MQNAVKFFLLLAAVGVACTSEVNETESVGEGISARSGKQGRDSIRFMVDERPTKMVNVDDPCEEYNGFDNDFYIVEENPCIPRYEEILIKRRQPQYRPAKYNYKRPVYKTVLSYPTWAPFKPIPMPPMKPLPTFTPWKSLPMVPLKPFKLSPLPTFKPLPVLSLPKIPLYKFPTMKPLPPYKFPTFTPWKSLPMVPLKPFKLSPLPTFKPLPVLSLPKIPLYKFHTMKPLPPYPYKFPTYAPLKPLPSFKPITFPTLPKPVKASSFVPVQHALGYSFWSYPVQLAPGLGLSPVLYHQNFAMPLPFVRGPSGQLSLQNMQVATGSQAGFTNGSWLSYNAVPIVHGSSVQPTSLQPVYLHNSQVAAPAQGDLKTIGNIYASNMSFVILNCAPENLDAGCSSVNHIQRQEPSRTSVSNGLTVVEAFIAQPASSVELNIGRAISQSALKETTRKVTGEESPLLPVVHVVDLWHRPTPKPSHLVSPIMPSTKELVLDESNLNDTVAISVGVSESKASDTAFTLHSASNDSFTSVEFGNENTGPEDKHFSLTNYR